MPTAGDTRPAEYALLVKGEFATAERRRTVSSGAACSALLFHLGP